VVIYIQRVALANTEVTDEDCLGADKHRRSDDRVGERLAVLNGIRGTAHQRLHVAQQRWAQEGYSARSGEHAFRGRDSVLHRHISYGEAEELIVQKTAALHARLQLQRKGVNLLGDGCVVNRVHFGG
jgi:hypothetical protein